MQKSRYRAARDPDPLKHGRRGVLLGGKWEAFPFARPTWPAASSASAAFAAADAADADADTAAADAVLPAAWEVWNLRFSCSPRRIAVAGVLRVESELMFPGLHGKCE